MSTTVDTHEPRTDNSPDDPAKPVGSDVTPAEKPLAGTVLPLDDVRPRQWISVDRLRPHPGHIREDLDQNEGFLASVANGGVNVSVIVVPDPERPGCYLIVDGVRRWTEEVASPSRVCVGAVDLQ